MILNSIYNNTLVALNKHTDGLIRLQEQATSGSMVNRASDNPTGAYQLLGLKTNQRQLQNYIDNINSASTVLQQSSTVTNEAASTLTDFRVTLTQVTSGTYFNEAQRRRTALEIDDILGQLVSYANTSQQGQYLFSGTSVKTQPYEVTRENGQITAVQYVGAENDLSAETYSSIETVLYKAGNDVFQLNSRTSPQFEGTTGAAAGSGTSNLKGFASLEVTHDALNNEYTLTINGGVDTYTIPDDGTGPDNLAVTDSTNGQVLYVDTTQITQAGVELVEAPGTHSVFDVLIMARDICQTSDGSLSEEQIREYLIGPIYNALEDISDQLTNESMLAGSKMSYLESIRNNLEDIEYNVQENISNIDEVDIAQVSIDLTYYEMLYQTSLSIASRMLTLSLFNFID